MGLKAEVPLPCVSRKRIIDAPDLTAATCDVPALFSRAQQLVQGRLRTSTWGRIATGASSGGLRGSNWGAAQGEGGGGLQPAWCTGVIRRRATARAPRESAVPSPAASTQYEMNAEDGMTLTSSHPGVVTASPRPGPNRLRRHPQGREGDKPRQRAPAPRTKKILQMIGVSGPPDIGSAHALTGKHQTCASCRPGGTPSASAHGAVQSQAARPKTYIRGFCTRSGTYLAAWPPVRPPGCCCSRLLQSPAGASSQPLAAPPRPHSSASAAECSLQEGNPHAVRQRPSGRWASQPDCGPRGPNQQPTY